MDWSRAKAVRATLLTGLGEWGRAREAFRDIAADSNRHYDHYQYALLCLSVQDSVGYRDACKTLGAGRMRIIRDVYMPGSFPSVMTGLRLGIGFGWRALIAGEFIVGTAAGGGIGFYIFDARTAGNIKEIMAGMIVLGLLWLLVDRLILRPIEETINTRWGATS